ncbi:MAG TPA: DMT family transporter [Alphaproteobacteria bacterium]|nr:DMT family transporter [Alphaproteobacteria bacterium]
MTLQERAQPLIDRYWTSLPGNLRGIVWMLLSALAFIAVQSATKMVGSRIDSAEITFFRCFFGGLAILPFLLKNRAEAFRTTIPLMHIGRGTAGAAAIFCMVYSVVNMPLAEATAIGFARPLFMIVLAVLFLREVVGWRRWTATAVGFGGVMIMLRPGIDVVSFAALAALLASLFFSLAHVFIKKITKIDHPMKVMAWYWAVSSVVTFLPMLFVWTTPNLEEFVLLMIVGFLSGTAQTLVVYSLRVGDASIVEPFDYSRIVWALLAGLLIFGESADGWVLLGAGVVAASNIYIARRAAKRLE